MLHQMRPASQSEDQSASGLYGFALRVAPPFLRISLGVVFLWIGITKFFDPKPVVGVLAASFSFLAFDTFVYVLGGLEVLVALLLFIGLGVRYAGLFILLFFVGTLTIFLITPSVVYGGEMFPALSLAGQFFLKDLALAGAALTIVVQDMAKHNRKQQA